MKSHTHLPSEEERYCRMMDELEPGARAYDRLLSEGRAPACRHRTPLLLRRLGWAAAACLVGLALGLGWRLGRGGQREPLVARQAAPLPVQPAPALLRKPIALPSALPGEELTEHHGANPMALSRKSNNPKAPAPMRAKQPSAETPETTPEALPVPGMDSPAYREACALLERELADYQLEQEIRQMAHDIERRGLTAEDLLQDPNTPIVAL